jgi:hypothetical protein
MKTPTVNLRNFFLALASMLLLSSASFAATSNSAVTGKEIVMELNAQGVSAVSAVPTSGAGNWLATLSNGKKVVVHNDCGILSIMVDPGL